MILAALCTTALAIVCVVELWSSQPPRTEPERTPTRIRTREEAEQFVQLIDDMDGQIGVKP